MLVNVQVISWFRSRSIVAVRVAKSTVVPASISLQTRAVKFQPDSDPSVTVYVPLRSPEKVCVLGRVISESSSRLKASKSPLNEKFCASFGTESFTIVIEPVT